MPSSSQKSDIASSLSKLSIDSSKKTLAAKNVKEPVADSWEDEDVDDGEEEDREAAKPQTDGSKAPPPTPISPSYNTADRSFSPYGAADSSALGAPPPADGDRIRRPEKTDAVARRMIASALGVKVPRMTEEQRAYDRAVKEKERKRRDEEKAAEKRRLEEAEKAKAAIWED
ncbi:hypothetical protein CH063_02192 [Colletotrichum higginsianum]|uniref:Ubiquitin-like protein smt3 n=2 Tax=Colletotrichum higginsianum TaxID=80884 RepID=H1VHN6_COLHI|nr:hypothetical protein CH63R_04604 [Colletotrichum higginsianum IMI 349063]OBR12308.1 hypothetical protein CH63R_04604 [Colletotrichum higginsianum IMI 349063]TIC99352.1 hypothetical protein CH35J_005559 [Colletotrichum higginsianum]GJC93993.1 hypothetical protein ColKHC_02819 [Colletotrichum higginsianum]CCF39739.1 hypothetical protein CH063_02192 [Colletotrichum higginsianum]